MACSRVGAGLRQAVGVGALLLGYLADVALQRFDCVFPFACSASVLKLYDCPFVGTIVWIEIDINSAPLIS